MADKLTRYELGMIKQMHDRQHYTCVDPKYLAEQLKRIDLPPRVSRFELAERVREIEQRVNE